MFIEQLKMKLGMSDEYDIQCEYEAGCLGYSLYNQLTAAGVKCVILAPTTMLTQQGKRVKTDARDALMIAQCLSYGGYHAVYIPTQEDDSVKEYLRMRDDHKEALKKIKQPINECTVPSPWAPLRRNHVDNQACHMAEKTGTAVIVQGNSG